MQMLKGDQVDNIPGVPGIGPVKAAKALAGLTTEEQMYLAVKELYEQHYGEKAAEALRENGQLLWMRRTPQEWWTPPSCANCEGGKSADGNA